VSLENGFPGEGDARRQNPAFTASVHQELARILRSPIFTRAPSLSRFLSHLVEQALADNPSQLSEYSLGVDVFDRGHSFDPVTDTIVRVQARRLRSRLDEYYRSHGQSDSVVIDLPKGQYMVLFRTAGAAAGGSAPGAGMEDPQPLTAGLAPPLPLPAACTSFVGREKELSDVKRLLRSDDARLVTLTGPGGSGKTRLALRIAGEITADFRGGVYAISLGSVLDPGTVSSTVARSVGLRHTGSSPLSEVLPLYLGLSVRHPTLLLLDNFEQVIEAAPLVLALLSGCPQLKVLVTSRALLHVSGEHEYPVPPLPKPDPKQLPAVEELVKNPAVALFVQRAGAVSASFTLSEDNAYAVAEICAHLDGLPLAIELAAARVKILPPDDLLGRLHSSLDLLTCGPRDLPARQQTLRKTMEWSHSLLNAPEQMLFRRLAVFAGGCTLESLEAVCNTRRDLGIGMLDSISSLVDKSLLRRHDVEHGRFTILQTIREYALEQLEASGEIEVTRRAYAAYYMVLAEEGAALMEEEERASWLALWDAEHDNLRDALDWLIETGNSQWALRLGMALFAFWQRREHFAEGRERLEAILKLTATASPTRERARIAWYAAVLADHQGDFKNSLRLQQESLRVYTVLRDDKGIAAQLCYVGQQFRLTGNPTEARRYFERSLAACRQLGDRNAIAMAANNFAEFLTEQGEYAPARCLFEETLAIFRALGNDSSAAWSLNHLADIAFHRKNLPEAHRLYSEAYDVFRTREDLWGVARSLADLGRLASEQNDPNAAHSFFEQALGVFLELRHTRGVARVLEGFACLAVRERQFDRALTLAAAAEGLRQKIGAPKRPMERSDLDRALQPAWQQVCESAAGAIWAQGQRMPLQDAIRYALARKPTSDESSLRS
jgi:predicted ATPase